MRFEAEPLEDITEESDFLLDYEIHVFPIGPGENEPQLPDFLNYYSTLSWPPDPELVLGWKYLFSLQRRLHWGFCSGNYAGDWDILHEIDTGLTSVHTSMANGLHRSGMQTLRNVLEMLIAAAVLTLGKNDATARRRWGGATWPRFSGRKSSLLDSLTSAAKVDAQEYSNLTRIYGQLSRYVHGYEAYWQEEELFDDFITQIYEQKNQRLQSSRLFVSFGEAVFPVVGRCLVR